MKMKNALIFFSAMLFLAFVSPPVSSSYVAGKTWYFHSISDDYIQFKLSKPDASGNGTFIWINGKEITDKKEGKYSLKNNTLTLNYYWAGVKTITKTYSIEHETKTGFVLIEQAAVNDNKKSFLFTASQ